MRKVKIRPKVALKEPEIILQLSPIEAEVLYFSCGQTAEIMMTVAESATRLLEKHQISDNAIEDTKRKIQKILGDIKYLEAIQTNLIDQARALGWDFSEDIIES